MVHHRFLFFVASILAFELGAKYQGCRETKGISQTFPGSLVKFLAPKTDSKMVSFHPAGVSTPITSALASRVDQTVCPWGTGEPSHRQT